MAAVSLRLWRDVCRAALARRAAVGRDLAGARQCRGFRDVGQLQRRYRPGARRFDVGETCVGTILPGAIAALEQLKAWSRANRRKPQGDFGSYALELEAQGFAIPPENRRAPHMFGATLPPGRTDDVAGRLREQNVFVSRRGSSIRFAPHLHVTEADLAQLADALRAIAGQRDERVSVTRLKDFAVAWFADSWKNSAVLKAKTARSVYSSARHCV